MLFYDPGMLIYTFIFVLVLIIGLITSKGHLGSSLMITVIWTIMYVLLWLMLSWFKTEGWLPDIYILKTCFGGCL